MHGQEFSARHPWYQLSKRHCSLHFVNFGVQCMVFFVGRNQNDNQGKKAQPLAEHDERDSSFSVQLTLLLVSSSIPRLLERHDVKPRARLASLHRRQHCGRLVNRGSENTRPDYSNQPEDGAITSCQPHRVFRAEQAGAHRRLPCKKY